MGKVFHKGPDRSDKATSVKIKRRGSNRITMTKMFDAERIELTESICVEKPSLVNIP
jgi:hypothetical protein